MPSLPPLPVRAQRGLARALAALPPRAAVALSGRPPVRLDGEELDPGIQLIMRVQALQDSPSFVRAGAEDVGAERRRVRLQSEVAQGRRTAVGAVRELSVEGREGRLRARHYTPPRDAEGAPLLVYAHGGGWVLGDLDTHDELCRLLCRHAGVHVLSIDYALAPEEPFPAAVDDLLAATAWSLRHAAELGADPDRVAVGGDSAGGNLAAVVAQEYASAQTGAAARERSDGRAPCLQLLIYPSTDFVDSWPSKELFSDGFYLDGPSREWCQRRYFSSDGDLSDPRRSPLRGTLAGVAPALVVTAAFDPLRDEGEAYAEAMRAAGAHAVTVRVPGMIHGFANMTGISRSARDAVLTLAGMLRAELARTTVEA